MNKDVDSQIVGEKHLFSTLDALRGVAAICVVFFHYSDNLKISLVPHAYLAVDFFFVLSGFVIAHAYAKRLVDGLIIKNIKLRRLLRLYPLYFLGLTIALMQIYIADLLHLPHSKRSLALVGYACGLIFMPTPARFVTGLAVIFPLNTPAWSLSLEMFVNLVYATFQRRLNTILLSTIVAFAGSWLIYYVVCHQKLDLGSRWSTYWGGYARVLWSFFLGIGLYKLYDWRAFKAINSWFGFVIGGALVFLFLCPVGSMLYDVLCVTVLLPGAVFIAAHVRSPVGRTKTLVSLLGTSSYALYITHMAFYGLFTMAYGAAGIDASSHPLRNTSLWVVIAVCLAVWLDLAYDVPVRRYLTRRLAKNRPTTKIAVS